MFNVLRFLTAFGVAGFCFARATSSSDADMLLYAVGSGVAFAYALWQLVSWEE